MLTKEEVQEVVLNALRNINEERSANRQIPIRLDTRLFGRNAVLDSLALVSVIVDVEDAISQAEGREISLSDDRAMSQQESPFSDANALVSYILLLQSEGA